jgi:hypothetical protein
MTTHDLVNDDCPLCIDGFQPAGIHPVLGPVFVWCEADITCSGCGGRATFPATAFTATARTWAPAICDLQICRTCKGVITVLPRIGGVG